jgi:uncharacterized RDD family membrane protein YckC
VNDAIPTASWGRRIVALVVDWIASTLVVAVMTGGSSLRDTGSSSGFLVLAVYVVESALFTWLLGGSFGKIATGLRVVPADGVMRPINPLLLLARQVMVALVIPPLVFRHDGRGLHDVLIGTATVPAAVFHAMVAGGPQGRAGRG